jgi:hypothetical protein
LVLAGATAFQTKKIAPGGNGSSVEFEERPGPAPHGSRDDVMRLFVSEEAMML